MKTVENKPPLHTISVVMLPVKNLVLHKQAHRVPKMQEEEQRAFTDDVKLRGVQDPIIVQKPNIILDGRHRWEAAKKRGDPKIPARVVELSELEQLDTLYGQALLRRNQTDDQRAVVAAYWCEVQVQLSNREKAQKAGKASQVKESLANAAHAKPKERKKRKDEEAAELHGVPLRKVRLAKKLVEEGDGLVKQVLSGELKLSQARRQMNVKPGKKSKASILSFTFRKPLKIEDVAKKLFESLGKEKVRDLEDGLRALRTEGKG